MVNGQDAIALLKPQPIPEAPRANPTNLSSLQITTPLPIVRLLSYISFPSSRYQDWIFSSTSVTRSTKRGYAA